MELSPKQQAFVAEYLKDKNATRAAKAAGYSKETAQEQGSRLLSKVMIKAAVQAGLAKQAERCEISADKTIKRIAQIAFDKDWAEDHNILKACELLGKHFKLFTDVNEFKGELDLNVISRDRARRIFKKLDDDC